MRFSRILIAVALTAIVAAAVAWRVTASRGALRPPAVAARVRPAARHELQPFLVPRPLQHAPPATCINATGPRACSSSIQACTLDITARTPVLQPGDTAVLTMRPGLHADQVPLGGNCQGFIDSP